MFSVAAPYALTSRDVVPMGNVTMSSSSHSVDRSAINTKNLANVPVSCMLCHYTMKPSETATLESLRERLTGLMERQPDLAPMHESLLRILSKNEADITQAEIDFIENTLKEMA